MRALPSSHLRASGRPGTDWHKMECPGKSPPRGTVYPAVTGTHPSPLVWITGNQSGFPKIASGASLHDLVVGLDFPVAARLLLPLSLVRRGAAFRRTAGLRCIRVELAGHLVPDLRERLARGADLLRVISLDRLLERLERAVEPRLGLGIDLLAQIPEILLRLV